MITSQKIRLLLGASCLVLAILSFFFPFYETVLMVSGRNISGLVRIYQEVEIGDIAVINGFGSMYAIANLPICLALSILLMVNKANLPTTIALGSLFLICQLLTLLGCSAGFGKPIGDRMLIGYQLMSTAEVLLIVISLISAIDRRRQARLKSWETIDNL